MNFKMCLMAVTCLTHFTMCFNDYNFCLNSQRRRDSILQICPRDHNNNIVYAKRGSYGRVCVTPDYAVKVMSSNVTKYTLLA